MASLKASFLKQLVRSSLALSSLLVLAASSSAWDARGHRQIADIAYSKLTPAAKLKLMAILSAGDKDYAPSRTGNPNTDPAVDSALRTAFQASSVWADDIKGNGYNGIFLSEITTYNKKWSFEPGTSEREQEKCKTWHYYDVAIRFPGKEPKVSESNAVNAVNFSVQQLTALNKSGSSDLKMQAFWVYWLNHVVGDLHQPLHCVSNYEFDGEKGDAGGNGIKLTDPEGKSDRLNLHSFWDRAITRQIAKEDAAGSDQFIPAVTKRWSGEADYQPLPKVTDDLDPMHWVKYGAILASEFAYSDGVKNGYMPDAKYIEKQGGLAKRQALVAGYRLAEILNKALK